jgi:hypothetical protein
MLQKLIDLIDKEFEYKGKNITIIKVKYVGTSFVVFTNRQTMNFFENEVEPFINELQEVKIKTPKIYTPMEITPKEEVKGIAVTSNIKQTLLDTLEKVKRDKSYIPQANAICNIVSQMINVMKVELQILNNKK